MSLRGWTIETPEAPWSVVVEGDVVVASGFTSLDELTPRLRDGSPSVEEVEPSGSVAERCSRLSRWGVRGARPSGRSPARRAVPAGGLARHARDPRRADLVVRRAGDEGRAAVGDAGGRDARARATWWRRSFPAIAWYAATGD